MVILFSSVVPACTVGSDLIGAFLRLIFLAMAVQKIIEIDHSQCRKSNFALEQMLKILQLFTTTFLQDLARIRPAYTSHYYFLHCKI